MTKKSNANSNSNHKSNQGNSNKGTNGVNKAYSQVQGNRGTQKNPNKK